MSTKFITLPCSCLAVVTAIGYILCLPIFYGIFAFGDHEDWECYAKKGSDVPWTADMGELTDDYTDVSQNFHMVNVWGFCNFVIPFGIGCLAVCCAICRFCGRETPEIVAAICFAGLFLSYLSHFITMVVMRWRHVGRVCSGDFNGNKMHFWAPLSAEEEPPYMPQNGSWLFYSAATQVYAVMMIVSSTSFVVGSED